VGMQMSVSRDEAKSLLLTHEHLTTEELRKALPDGVTAIHVERLRRLNNVVSLRFSRLGYLYPAFQADRENRRIWPVVTVVNRLLADRSAPDAIAWWYEADPEIGRPRCELLDLRAELIAATRTHASAAR
jgi:hypothetical protein